jgi:hypothetical protein
MHTFVVKTKEREYVFLFERNADRFAEKLNKRRIRTSISQRFTPRDETDEEYWMRHDGKDYSYAVTEEHRP